jgi:hypothetical protein
VKAQERYKVSHQVALNNMRYPEDPDAQMEVMHKLSVTSGGKQTGPLTKFAGQFARLNFFREPLLSCSQFADSS